MKIKSIKLTGFFGSGAIQGSLGDIVEVTPENEEACRQLIKDKGAHAHLVEPTIQPEALKRPLKEADGDEDDEGSESDDDPGLTDIDDSDGVDTLDIAPRYKQALKDAGISTVADVKAASDLAAVPGLNKSVAAKILHQIE